jgi:FAD/FMN-containing dehydrogenase
MSHRSPVKVSRRKFLKSGFMSGTALALSGCLVPKPHFTAGAPAAAGTPTDLHNLHVNDIHSQLNSALVGEIAVPGSIDECQSILRGARTRGKVISVAGGRHSMGGQQFADDSLLIDTRGMKRVLGFDREKGLLDVEAGIEWPELIQYLHQKQDAQNDQEGQARQWAIVQKQTGADKFTLGGSLASNVHGRALDQKPIIANVESFRLLDATANCVSAAARRTRSCFAWPSADTDCSA